MTALTADELYKFAEAECERAQEEYAGARLIADRYVSRSQAADDAWETVELASVKLNSARSARRIVASLIYRAERAKAGT